MNKSFNDRRIKMKYKLLLGLIVLPQFIFASGGDDYPVKRSISHRTIQTLSKSTYEKHKHNEEIAYKDLHKRFKEVREYSSADDMSIEDQNSYSLAMIYDSQNSTSAKNADVLAQKMELLHIDLSKETSDRLCTIVNKKFKTELLKK
jgi:hypothetical protein